MRSTAWRERYCPQFVGILKRRKQKANLNFGKPKGKNYNLIKNLKIWIIPLFLTGCRLTSLRKRQSFVETINTAKGLRFARKPFFILNLVWINDIKSKSEPFARHEPTIRIITSWCAIRESVCPKSLYKKFSIRSRRSTGTSNLNTKSRCWDWRF